MFRGDNNIFKTSVGDKDIFTITKIKYNGTLKTRLVSETSISVNSDFYTSKRQNKHGTFEAND